MKIKTVEIENFRGYKDKQLFNFMNKQNDKVSDLVVIFAPNGFGKTSFIDSIEWLFTGQVKRINKSNATKKAFENEKKDSEELFLLKNNSSKSQYGFVKLTNEKDHFIKAKTKEITERGKCDYSTRNNSENRENLKKDGIFEGFQEKEFLSNNLVTSDKINSFLQFDDPKERFLILEDIWDTDNSSEIYQKVLELSSDFNRQFNELKEKIKNQGKVIKKLENNKNTDEIINKLINEINYSNNETNLKLKNAKDNKNLKIEPLLELNVFKDKEINSLKRDIKRTDELIKNYFQYKVNLEKMYQIADEKAIFSLKDDLEKNEKYIKELNYISNNVIFLKKHRYQLKEKNEIINETIKKQNRILKDSNNYNKKIKKLNEDITQFEKKMEEIIGIEGTFNIVSLNKSTLISNDIFIEKIKIEINEIFEQVNVKKDQINAVENLVNALEKKYEISDELKSIEEIQINKVGDEINNYINLLKKYEKEKKDLELIKDTFLEQQEKINKLFSICFDVLKDQKTSNCPICDTKFETKDNLLKVIKNNSDNLKLLFYKKEESQLEKLKTNILKKEKEIKLKLDSIYSKLNKELLECNESLKKEKEKQKSLIDKNKKINEFEKNHRMTLEKMSTFFNENIDTLNNLIIKKEELKNKKAFNENEISELKNSIKNLDLNMTELKNIIDINEGEIKYLESDQNYKMILNLLKKMELTLEKEEEILYLENTKSQVREKITDITKKLLKYKEIDSIYNIDKINIDEIDKIECQNKEEVNFYSQEFEDLGLGEVIISDFPLKKLKRSLEEKLIKFEKENESIEKLLKIIKVSKDNEELNKDLEKLKVQKEHILIKKQTFEELKEKCEKILSEKISKAFNLDGINNIYKMIDPHPELKKISFKPDFKNAKPELHIIASKGEEKHSPVLYFSSAQVSILALSIFFAKALQSNNGLDTIFLDDPIQHLDSINTLAFIDFIRNIITSGEVNKQIVLTTNNKTFFNMLKRKLDDKYYNSKFIELESYGKIKAED